MKNILNKALPLLLAFLILIATNAGSITVSAAVSFKDVKTTAWYCSYISRLVELEIISGYSDGTYKPNSPVTRAEFLTLLCKAAGHQPAKGASFIDTDKHWASGYIAIALSNGIVDIPADKRFRPGVAITRLETVEMLCRALNIAKDKTTTPYKDISSADSGYTGAAYANYLMQGSQEKTGRYFKPSGKLTRAEAAAIIVNAYEYHADKMAYLNKKVDAEKEKAEKEKAEAQKYQEWLDSIDKGVSKELLNNTVKLTGGKTVYESHQLLMKEMSEGRWKEWIKVTSASNGSEFVKLCVESTRLAVNSWCNTDYRKINELQNIWKSTMSFNFNYSYANEILYEIKSNTIVREGYFYTGEGLLSYNEDGQFSIRGTVRYRYLTPSKVPKGRKLNVWYEEDIRTCFYPEDTGLKVASWTEISNTRVVK